MRYILPLSTFLFIQLLLTSCGDPDPKSAPTRDTPVGAKVDLTNVSLSVTEPSIVKTKDGKYRLRFNYTLENTSGSNIRFPCLYANIDHLIEVTLADNQDQAILLGKRTLDGLTLAQPSPKRILIGKTTRPYSVPIAANALKKNDPVRVRIRFHVPSRYDELRSSLEAPALTLAWPGEPEAKKP